MLFAFVEILIFVLRFITMREIYIQNNIKTASHYSVNTAVNTAVHPHINLKIFRETCKLHCNVIEKHEKNMTRPKMRKKIRYVRSYNEQVYIAMFEMITGCGQTDFLLVTRGAEDASKFRTRPDTRHKMRLVRD